jgi:hypothetical protein
MSSDGGITPALSVTAWPSVAQMWEVERLMVEDLGISLARMMEDAGRSVAVVARRMLPGLTPRRAQRDASTRDGPSRSAASGSRAGGASSG